MVIYAFTQRVSVCAKRLIPRPFILPVNSLENFVWKGMFRTLIFTRAVFTHSTLFATLFKS